MVVEGNGDFVDIFLKVLLKSITFWVLFLKTTTGTCVL